MGFTIPRCKAVLLVDTPDVDVDVVIFVSIVYVVVTIAVVMMVVAVDVATFGMEDQGRWRAQRAI